MSTGMFSGGPKIENGFAGPLFAEPLFEGSLGAGAVVIKRGSLGVAAGGGRIRNRLNSVVYERSWQTDLPVLAGTPSCSPRVPEVIRGGWSDGRHAAS